MLKHYGLYLDPDFPEDQELIAYLAPYTKPRRVGEILRRALVSYINGGSPVPAAARPVPLPQQSTGYLAPASASTVTAADKVKRAFMK